MKKLFAISVTVAMSFILSPANAGEAGELRARINASRDSLVTLMTNKEQQGADQQKLVKDTADAVSAYLAKMKAPAGKEPQLSELAETWKAFKETREKELVPAILKGDNEAVRKIAYGIQKERITKCISLSKELGN